MTSPLSDDDTTNSVKMKGLGKGSSTQLQEESPWSSLYNKAIECMYKKQYAAEKVTPMQALNDAKAASNSKKINKTSLKLSLAKTRALVQAAVADFEPVSLHSYRKILEKLEVLYEAHPVLSGREGAGWVKAPPKADLETEFLKNSWNFINKAQEETVPADSVAEVLLLLLSTELTRAEQTRKLKSFNEDDPNLDTITQFIYNLHSDALMSKPKVPSNRHQKTLRTVEADLTFNPKLCKQSEILNSNKYKNVEERINGMINSKKQAELQTFVLKLEKQANELAECKFAPNLTANFKPKEYTIKNPKDKRSTLEKELQLCTFQPTIPRAKPKKQIATSPRGFEDSVKRLRDAKKAKEEQKELNKKLFATGESYDRSKQLPPEPFSFMSRNKQEKQVLAYVDVKLGNCKKGRIAIHPDDDLKVLAKSFCRVFALGKEAQEGLVELLEKQKEMALDNQ